MIDSLPIFSMEEVGQHNNESSLWLAIHGIVYDVTMYFQNHPGGGDPLIKCAGKDATVCFEEHKHEDQARELMEVLQIGKIGSPSDCQVKQPAQQVTFCQMNPSKESDESSETSCQTKKKRSWKRFWFGRKKSSSAENK